MPTSNHTRKKSAQTLRISHIRMTDMSTANGYSVKALLSLQEAAEVGDYERVQLLLSQKKMNVNLLDRVGEAALHKATENGHLKVVQLLVEHPMLDINSYCKNGYAAVHLAVKHRRQEILRLLLSHGARMDLMCSTGKSALHMAARKANKDLIEVLLSQPHCDVDIRSRSNSTPLHFAIKSGSYDICQLLINSGASVCKEDIGHQTALILAAVEKNVNILQLIIDTAKSKYGSFKSYLHQKDHEGSTALHLAVVNNHCEHVKRLLEAGADVNCVKTDSSTALHLAAMFGFVKIAELLVKNGADLHGTTVSKQTPLHRAAAFDSRSDFAQLIMLNGADINAVDVKDMSPLHYAVRKGRLEIVRFLISNGALVDLTDDLGRSILHHSVISNQLSCLELLVELLPQDALERLIAFKDVGEKTALHYCAERGKLDFLLKLLHLGASPAAGDEDDRTPLHLAAKNGYPKCITALFRHSKSEINDDDAEGCTPMLLACLNGHYASVKALLKHGGDVSARGRDEYSHTALTAAACNGHLEIIDLLLEHVDDTEVCTKYQETAMHLACRGNYSQVVELLLQYSASVICRNHKDQTPLDVAIECRSHQAAAAIITSDKWQEAMDCVDEGGNNPLPRLIAFMPSIAKLVLDRCIQHKGNPEKEDFAVTYNFKYMDPSPLSHCCKNGKAWYAADMVEHECKDLMMHEVTQMNMRHKWLTFGRGMFVVDFIYYTTALVTLSVFIDEMPNVITDHQDYRGFPMNITDEEASNATVLEELKMKGTLDRFERPSEQQAALLQILRITTYLLLSGTTVRLVVDLITLRLLFFKKGATYVTMSMISCLAVAILAIDETTFVLKNYQWRAAWIGMFLAWLVATHYLIRVPVIGIYMTMFYKVLSSVIKTLLVMLCFFAAFAWCFSITQHRTEEFETPYIGLLSTMNMALGELSFVDRFVISNTGPFRGDNFVLITIFMVVVPIALVNLLIGVAVGDIDLVKSKATLRFISLNVETIDEYQRHALKYVQKKWYIQELTLYPNRVPKGIFAKMFGGFTLATRKATYQRSGGWEYERKLNPVIDTVEILSERLEQTNERIKEMEKLLRQQKELLMSMADKMGAELDDRGKCTG
ncbi:transient receptor potential cation channel subfamily A member 1-like isoform X2 [Watersipora subatra]|uniref:transient receptor potential cation channel subfamily A member 1-like isoform X2 n=1 Tax=Watersipora subatra TaxID=2589382 RepID=UPI00355C42B7